MSMEGVRVLAKALEENCSRGVSHVYVHSEGRIDALGRRKEGKSQVSNDSLTLTRAWRTRVSRVKNSKTHSPYIATSPGSLQATSSKEEGRWRVPVLLLILVQGRQCAYDDVTHDGPPVGR